MKNSRPLLLGLFVFVVVLFLAFFVHSQYFREYPILQTRAFHAMESVLNWAFVSRIGTRWTTILLSAFAPLLGIFVYWRHSRVVARRPSQGRASTGNNKSDINVQEMIAGVAAQVAYEQELTEARQQSSHGVRLVPRTYSHTNSEVHSWFGGTPQLPDSFVWPRIDGDYMCFIAQIDCTRLPADLWSGMGPRAGWLTFFVAPTWPPRTQVVYTTTTGSHKQNPDPKQAEWYRTGGFDFPGLAPARTDYQPYWPIDIVAGSDLRFDQKKAIPEERRIENDRTSLFDQGIDLQQPQFQPFDWPTTIALLQMAINHVATAVDSAASAIERHRQSETSSQQALAEAEDAEQRDLLLRRIAHHGKRIRALEKLKDDHQQSQSSLNELLNKTLQSSNSSPFSPAAITTVLNSLSSIGISHLAPADPSEQQPDVLPTGIVSVPATKFEKQDYSTSRFNKWIWEFESYRQDAAMRVYNQNPGSLPTIVRDFYEKQWTSLAVQEAGNMGDIPLGFIHQFNWEEEFVLLELPTSHLLYWIWGDMYHLVLTIKKESLSNCDFTNARFHISN